MLETLKHALLVIWPFLLAFLLLAFLMVRYQIRPSTAIFKHFREQNGKRTSCLLLFLLIQAGLIYLLQFMTLHQIGVADKSIIAVLFAATLLSLAVIFVALKWAGQTKADAILMTQQVYLDDLNRMLTTMRGQRHDFLNHVQVIQSFVKMGKFSELERYTQELVGEISETNQILHIGDPALSALIQSKLITAEHNKIWMQQHFSDLEDLSLGVKSVDIVKIVGNLLDNAFDEVTKLHPDLRWVEMKGWKENEMLIFTVRNPGRFISEGEIAKIFSLGYSTKDHPDHRGIGLSVVKERVEHYNGMVHVESHPEKGTVFQVEIPLKLNWNPPVYP